MRMKSNNSALESCLESLSIHEATVKILRNFASHTCKVDELPRNRLCGVLILLFIDQNEELSCVLNTRSLSLRSHPGDVCLPGGRVEGNETIQQTALREAHEENNLSFEGLIFLTNLQTFVSASGLFVVPSVYFTPRRDFLKDLIANPSEVDQIFSAPLDYFGNTESLIHKEVDLIWLAGTNYKLHQFHHASFPKMVSGLTADILMTTVLIGAGLSEAEEEAEEGSWDGNVGRFKFKRRAEGQMTWSETVKVALRSDKDAFQSRAL